MPFDAVTGAVISDYLQLEPLYAENLILPLKNLKISLKSKKVDDESTKYGILSLIYGQDLPLKKEEICGGDIWQQKRDVEEEKNE